MIKVLPDKWVRKSIYDAMNDMIINSIEIPFYDSRVTGNNIPSFYVLMTTQTNDVDKANKCEDFWQSSILLDVVTSYDAPGNTGSRLMADNIADEIRSRINGIALDVASGLEIITKTISLPNDISTVTKNENIFRKLIRLEMLIK